MKDLKGLALSMIVVLNLLLVGSADLWPWKAVRATLQNNVGFLYWKGIGVSTDIDNSAKWLGRAVANGSADAANNLAELYESHPEIAPEKDEIIELYRLAAASNIATAQNNLGVLLLERRDPEALEWFRRAANSRDRTVATQAQENLVSAQSILAGDGNRR